MNETLKGVAHIGAELAAAKADLQLEMERHRKTWRQLEQVNNAMRRIIERCEVFIDDEAEMSTASVEVLMGIAEDALSQQPYPTDTFTAVDMATAAAQGFRDGQAAAEVEALRKDAERYRWASSGVHEAETLVSIVNCHGGYAEKVAERVDVYREAAMAAKEA